MKKSPIMLKAETRVPIYGNRLLLVLCVDTAKALKTFGKRFGKHENVKATAGSFAWNEYEFGLFFDALEFDDELIAHEVFHATHRILKRNGVVFTTDNHEPFAFLCGWITKWVYATARHALPENRKKRRRKPR